MNIEFGYEPRLLYSRLPVIAAQQNIRPRRTLKLQCIINSFVIGLPIKLYNGSLFHQKFVQSSAQIRLHKVTLIPSAHLSWQMPYRFVWRLGDVSWAHRDTLQETNLQFRFPVQLYRQASRKRWSAACVMSSLRYWSTKSFAILSNPLTAVSNDATAESMAACALPMSWKSSGIKLSTVFCSFSRTIVSLFSTWGSEDSSIYQFFSDWQNVVHSVGSSQLEFFVYRVRKVSEGNLQPNNLICIIPKRYHTCVDHHCWNFRSVCKSSSC